MHSTFQFFENAFDSSPYLKQFLAFFIFIGVLSFVTNVLNLRNRLTNFQLHLFDALIDHLWIFIILLCFDISFTTAAYIWFFNYLSVLGYAYLFSLYERLDHVNGNIFYLKSYASGAWDAIMWASIINVSTMAILDYLGFGVDLEISENKKPAQKLYKILKSFTKSVVSTLFTIDMKKESPNQESLSHIVIGAFLLCFFIIGPNEESMKSIRAPSLANQLGNFRYLDRKTKYLGALVGAFGFASTENLFYAMLDPSNLWIRPFVTTPLHVAMTSISTSAIALDRSFKFSLALAAFLHGLYDFFAILDQVLISKEFLPESWDLYFTIAVYFTWFFVLILGYRSFKAVENSITRTNGLPPRTYGSAAFEPL